MPTLSPDPSSKRSKRRTNRGFKGLLASSRKHRRALRRQEQNRTINGKIEEPGTKALCASGPNPRKQWLHTAAGSLRYH